jgi:hypothetical protein
MLPWDEAASPLADRISGKKTPLKLSKFMRHSLTEETRFDIIMDNSNFDKLYLRI